MKALLALVGLATSCLLSGCAHHHPEATIETASKPDIAATTNQTASLTVNSAGTAPLSYQWQFNGTNTGIVTVTNLQGATFSVVTNTGTPQVFYQWYSNTNIQPVTNN